MKTEYYKSRLSPSCHKAYDDMLRKFKQMAFEVDAQGVSPQDLMATYSAIVNDHPELFYLSYRAGVGQKMGFFGVSLKLKTSSIFSASQVGTYKIELDKIAKNFKKQTESIKSDEQKILYVCDYFLKNMQYEINNEFNQNCATALVKNKAQCSGISKAVKYILDNLGIDCILVEGDVFADGKGGPHAWNMVWLEGQPYHLDVTSMMGANMTRTEPFYYMYYLYSDDEMNIHKWDRNKYPKCDKTCPNKPINAQNGQQTTNTQRQQKKNSVPLFPDNIVKFSLEMEKQIKSAILKKQPTLCFSTALSVEGQELLDEVTKVVKKVLRQNSAISQFTVKIIGGFNVEITFIW